MSKNFGKLGFSKFGLSNFSFLRRRGMSREKAIAKLMREDKSRKDAVTFRQRNK